MPVSPAWRAAAAMAARLPRIGTVVALSSAYQPGACQPAARARASIRSRAWLRLSLLKTGASADLTERGRRLLGEPGQRPASGQDQPGPVAAQFGLPVRG